MPLWKRFERQHHECLHSPRQCWRLPLPLLWVLLPLVLLNTIVTPMYHLQHRLLPQHTYELCHHPLELARLWPSLLLWDGYDHDDPHWYDYDVNSYRHNYSCHCFYCSCHGPLLLSLLLCYYLLTTFILCSTRTANSMTWLQILFL